MPAAATLPGRLANGIELGLHVVFSAMAVTIMAGLMFTTILTLIVNPVLHVTFIRIPTMGDAA
ncbi:MAG: hypothetical protein ACYSX0_06295 [Planctomycetota bacterium]|jgi:multidrug efflux pump subunit AcrB